MEPVHSLLALGVLLVREPSTIAEAFATLMATEPLFGRLRVRRAKQKAANILSASGDISDFWSLGWFAVGAPGASRDVAVRAMTEIVARLGPSRLFWEEHLARNLSGALTIDALLRAYPLGTHGMPPIVAAALSASCNGYVREVALRALGENSSHASSIYAVLARLNDWVPEVRSLADSIGIRLIQDLPKAELVGLLPEIVALTQRAHASKSLALLAVVERLVGLECRDLMLDALASKEMSIRRGALVLFVNRRQLVSPRGLLGAGDASDQYLRGRLVRRVLSELKPENNELSGLLSDATPGVRLVALELLSSHDAPAIRDALLEALFDSSHAVRWAAQHSLRGSPEVVRAAYRACLETGGANRRLIAALRGLSNLSADNDDMRLVREWIMDGRPTVSANALVALSRWPVEPNREQFVAALFSASSRVSRAATAILETVPTLAVDVLERLASSEHAFHRVNALRLRLRFGTKWDRLRCLLDVLCSQDAASHEIAERNLVLWLSMANRSFYSVSSEERGGLLALLESVPSDHIRADLRRDIASFLSLG